nr:MAG TPA: hypothetical protein [Caudoviricetes sp.]
MSIQSDRQNPCCISCCIVLQNTVFYYEIQYFKPKIKYRQTQYLSALQKI